MKTTKRDRTDETASLEHPWTTGPSDLGQLVEGMRPAARSALAERLQLLLTTLTGSSSDGDDVYERVADAVGTAADRLWLAHAVLAAELPTDEEMLELETRARLGGTWAALAPALERLDDTRRLRTVEVVRGAVTCDVHTTAGSTLLSGIQRVVRETTRRWHDTREVVFVGWTGDRSALRRLKPEEETRMFGGGRRTSDGVSPVVVPWECTHLWVEVVTDVRRTGRLLALAQASRNEVGVLGYDSIPVTSSATVADGMTAAFARSLAAVRQADRVALISGAAAEEFRGVMAMGAGRRDRGPEVAAVPLAVEAFPTTAEDLAEAEAGLVVGGLPMVLVVGSHEPRKNHVAVLHAAERLWREGLRFSLVLVGAGSWNASEYEAALGDLVATRRPVQSLRALPDRLLWAAYRLAHVTIFPSLNEGFGLPVAESLAAGTPAITSEFGSMRDIVAPDGTPLGGLLVDPRDDEAVAGSLRRVLTDRELHARLVREARDREPRTWYAYAEELWAFLVDGTRPPG